MKINSFETFSSISPAALRPSWGRLAIFVQVNDKTEKLSLTETHRLFHNTVLWKEWITCRENQELLPHIRQWSKILDPKPHWSLAQRILQVVLFPFYFMANLFSHPASLEDCRDDLQWLQLILAPSQLLPCEQPSLQSESELLATIATLQKEKTELTARLNTQINELQEKILSYKQQINELEAKISELEREHSQQTSESTAILENTQKVQGLKREVQRLQSVITELTQENENFSNSIEEKETKIRSLTQIIAKLQSELTEISEERNDLSEQATPMRTQNSRYESQIKTLQEQLTTIQRQNEADRDAWHTERDRLTNKIQDLSRQYTQTEHQKEELERNIDILEHQKIRLEKRIESQTAETSSTIQQLKEDLSLRKLYIDELEGWSRELEAELERFSLSSQELQKTPARPSSFGTLGRSATERRPARKAASAIFN
ncbi:MAG: hypothetical protein JW769_04160 [Parachlamydiales bacterium]|nr:hypothetical protein [Parachlamydiales bacterium]